MSHFFKAHVARLLALLTFGLGLVWLWWTVMHSTKLKSGIAWAVRSWFVPPDAESVWEQVANR